MNEIETLRKDLQDKENQIESLATTIDNLTQRVIALETLLIDVKDTLAKDSITYARVRFQRLME
jgi:predicted  nucleic acid-binding Zn-ribbon protein